MSLTRKPTWTSCQKGKSAEPQTMAKMMAPATKRKLTLPLGLPCVTLDPCMHVVENSRHDLSWSHVQIDSAATPAGVSRYLRQRIWMSLRVSVATKQWIGRGVLLENAYLAATGWDGGSTGGHKRAVAPSRCAPCDSIRYENLDSF